MYIAPERALVEAGSVAKAIDKLQADKLVYRSVLEPPKGQLPDDWEAREQLLFRATDFGDDIDRPLQNQIAAGPILPLMSPIMMINYSVLGALLSIYGALIMAAM